MLTFYPAVKEALRKIHGEAFQEDDYEPYSEMIFVVDRSGSMAGTCIEQVFRLRHLHRVSLNARIYIGKECFAAIPTILACRHHVQYRRFR